eukprot:5733575-Karenia_brevis.AAC.1
MFVTLARTVWRQDTSLAKYLISVSPFAASTIRVLNNKVVLYNYNSFVDKISSIRSAHIQGQIDHINRRPPRSRDLAAPRLQSLLRKAKLWVPLDRKHILSGVLIEKEQSGSSSHSQFDIADSPSSMRDAIVEHWGPIMQEKPIDLQLAQSILEESGVSDVWDWVGVPPPSPLTYMKILEKKEREGDNSATGADGIPFCAWEANKQDSADTFYEVSTALRHGAPPPPWYAALTLIFLLK